MSAKLPLIDLHRHLDGNVRLQTILDLGRQHNIRLPGDTIETLRPHVQVTGVMPDLVTWLNKLHWMIAVLGDYDACRRIARENVEDAHAEGMDYVELRFSPYFMAGPNKLDPAKVVEAVVTGIEEGRAKTGLKVNLIGILSRTFGAEACNLRRCSRSGRTSSHLISRATKRTSRPSFSWSTSSAGAMPAGRSRRTPVKRAGRRASGRR
jgi:adenosine deaminase